MKRIRGSLRSILRERARSPLFWILIGLAVVRTIGIGWGLPASDGWDNDGVAPRDFLPGLMETFSPGRFYTYPPLHLAILAVVTSPIAIVALVRAPHLAAADVVTEFIKVPYMTGMALVARVVSIVMSLGIAYAIARIVEETHGKRAGWLAALVCGLNVPLTYYAHTTNLDVPYLFWACFAILALVRSVARGEPKRLRTAAILAALAVATKDQAYALFVFALPATIVAWLATDPSARRDARPILVAAAKAAVIGAAALLVVDGAAFNPSGFRARVAFLLGSASQDFAQYSADGSGRWRALVDAGSSFGDQFPLAFAALFAIGFVVSMRRTQGSRRIAALVPLLCAASFTVFFNLAARRVEHRFVMPQAILVAVYGGVALDALLTAAKEAWQRGIAIAAIAAALAWGTFRCVEVDAMLLFDPRYDVEAWLDANVARGDVIEVHGLNVYLPRMPARAHTVRVGPDPTDRRNPLPGVEELRDTYERTPQRAPRWIVVSQAWAWRYRIDASFTPTSGRILPPTQERGMDDTDATSFFQALFRGERGYKLAHTARWSSRTFERVDINASLGVDVFVFERNAP